MISLIKKVMRKIIGNGEAEMLRRVNEKLDHVAAQVDFVHGFAKDACESILAAPPGTCPPVDQMKRCRRGRRRRIRDRG